LHETLRPLAEHASDGVLLVDFDGSLAPIVDDPSAAAALPDARDALGALVGLIDEVGVVSGRPVAFLLDALGLDGITYVGQYGVERWDGDRVITDPRVDQYVDAVGALAAQADHDLPGVFVERKGAVAFVLHWRNRPELADAAEAWAAREGPPRGLALHPGRMVVELRPPVPIDKGSVVEELAAGRVAAAFAGDDSGDLTAFDALDRLQDQGKLRFTTRIGVRSPEEPPELVARADVHVAGPAGLAELLRELGDAIRRAPA
jgi:trehalose 6-phosphate phosphatase